MDWALLDSGERDKARREIGESAKLVRDSAVALE